MSEASIPDVPNAAPAPAAEKPIGAVAAAVGAFASPDATFGRLVKAPTWWLPFVVALVVSGAFGAVLTSKVDIESTVRAAMEKRMGHPPSEQQVEQAVSMQEKFTSPAIYAGFGLVGASFGFFVVGLVLWGAARAFGGDVKYGQVLAAWAHAGLPNSVGAILSLPILAMAADGSIRQDAVGRFVKSNIGAFLSDEAPKALLALGSSIDVFSLWALALLVIAFRKFPGLSKGSATGIPVGLWAIYVLVKTAWAAVFG